MPMTTEYAQALANAGLSYKTAFERLAADLKRLAESPYTKDVNPLFLGELFGLSTTVDFTLVQLVGASQTLTWEAHRLEKASPGNARARRYNARRRAKAAAAERPAAAPYAYAPQPAPYIPAVPTTPVAPPQPPGGAHTGGAQPSAQGAQPIDYTALAESAAPTPELEALKNLFE